MKKCTEVVEQQCGEPAKRVFSALLARAHVNTIDGRWLWEAGRGDLVDRTGMTWPTINRHLAEMERLGVLVRYGRVNAGNGMTPPTCLIVINGIVEEASHDRE